MLSLTMYFFVCRTIRSRLAVEIAELATTYKGFQPHLTIVQVGNREDSSLYVRMKEQAALKAGIKFTLVKLSAEIGQGEVCFLFFLLLTVL
jgi:methylenetetrahydrofolate dehydrogenase (NADP+)/methenyltetrahydrofolate cyclohydrolase/formyltetrahydrofolate synthetase